MNRLRFYKTIWALMKQWVFVSFLFCQCYSVSVLSSSLSETTEVVFTSEASLLANKAAQLKSPAAIYEYVRNSHEFTLYQGAMSNSLNSFLGKIGDDIDLASVLISMFRSQGIPARYASGIVNADATEVANWLGVENLTLAAALLDDAGIPNVSLKSNNTPVSIEFEHVWVQVFLPYGNYRGINIEPSIDCFQSSENCQWINLDPSWKLSRVSENAIDIYGIVNFDYDRYYNAVKNDDTEYRDKNPLEIYQEQILGWLQVNYPGKALNDIPLFQEVIEIEDGLLPASLPYQVISEISVFDSVSDHDAASPLESWGKTIELSFTLDNFLLQNYTGVVQLSTLSPAIALTNLSTKRLSLSHIEANGIVGDVGEHHRLVLKLDDEIVHTPLIIDKNNNISTVLGVAYGVSFQVAGFRPTLVYSGLLRTFSYIGLQYGESHIINVSNDTANSSQLQRASDKLIQASKQFPVISDGMGIPYVDINSNGTVDAGELKLIDDFSARSSLTLGLLDVNSRNYAARFIHQKNIFDHLNHVRSPSDLNFSIVSSTLDVEYYGDTPFSVVPGGLLIDVQNSTTGFWRIDEASLAAKDHAELIGTQGSSLEHETWQETTGFDAISTVRGIQMAVADGGKYLTPDNTGISNNWLEVYEDFQFSDNVPLGFIYKPFILFGTQPAAWMHSVELSQMEFMKREVSDGITNNKRSGGTYTYASNGGFYGWINCVDGIENALLAANPFQSVQVTYCDGTVFSGFVTQVIDQVRDHFLNYTVPVSIGQELFDFFDRVKGFDRADHIYRAKPLTQVQHSEKVVRTIRDSIMIGDTYVFDDEFGNPTINAIFEYRLANLKTDTGFNIFSARVEKRLFPGDGAVGSMGFFISNDGQTAGGGWVDGTQELSASDVNVTIIQPEFDNELFNDEDLVSQLHNDLIKTPSTIDPVSTVTGNMYHDETDLTIKSRGMPYVFTRTYNSGPGSSNSDGPFGFGWTHAYNLGLISNDYGDCPNCLQGTDTSAGERPENGNNTTSSITYVDERGGAHTYLLNADTAGTRSVAGNPPGEFDTLLLNTPVAGKHTLEFRNGVKYVFDEVGASSLLAGINQYARLDYIEDPYSNRLTMAYDGSNRLIGVSDNLNISGRTGLTITYVGTTQHINKVSDWAGRTWAYLYDSDDNLVSVENPLSQFMTYTYHDNHLLNIITKPQDRSGQKNSMAFRYYHNKKAFDYQNSLGHVESLSYDLYRQKTAVTDPRGFVRNYFYGADNGALKKLEEPDGAILLFDNNLDGLRYKKINGLGYETQYSFLADRSISALASNTNGLVTREIDALNQQLDRDYGIYDQLTTVQDKRGNTFVNQYYAVTDIPAKSVAGKLRREYAVINGQSELLRRYYYYADPAQPDFGQLERIQEFFDPGNLSRRRVTRFYWDATNGIDLIKIERSGVANSITTTGAVTVGYSYDNLGRKITETLHRLTSATDATLQSLITTFEYDALDRIIKTTNPRGDIAEIVYDQNGLVYQKKVHYLTTQPRDNCAAPAINNGNSYVTCTYATNVYDAADRLVQTIDVLGHSQTVSYDAIGNISTQTDANGNTTRFEYGAMNRRTAIIDANGHKATLKYDLAGRLVKVTNANGHSMTNQYDAIGRLIKTVTQEGRETELSYDANGNQTHLIDANATANAAHPRNTQNASIYTEYDELNRPFRVTDALNGETITAYDLLGNITSITDAQGQVTQFVYDELGRLLETIDPIIETGTDKTKKIVVYNQANQPLRTVDRAGVQIDYSYDELGRLTQRYSNSGILEISEYDDFGDLVKQASLTHTYEYAYTPRHKLQQKIDKRGDKALNWVYDAVGNVISKTDYQNEVTHYQYDSTNRLVAMQNKDYLQVSYHYDGAGRLLNRILSNGAQTNYKYDHDNRLTELENLSFDPANPAQKQTVEKLAYQRDQVGNITQINNPNELSLVNYSYDALYRLTVVDSNFNSEDRIYSYDAVGNRKTERKNGTTYFYCYHETNCSQPPVGNRLYNIRTGSLTGAIYRKYAYDSRGNMTTRRDGSNNLLAGWSFNATNQPVWLFEPDGSIHFATYDTAGYRIAYQRNGLAATQVVKSNRYFLEGEHIEAVYTDIGCPDTEPNGCITENTEYLLDKKYLRGVVVDEIVNGYDYNMEDGTFDKNDWTNHTFHHDHLNTVTALTGHNGDVEEQNRFDAFGAPLNAVNDNTLLFTGREYDSIQAVYYYRARYYDPEIGRFISEDPLGFAAGQINLYVYVNNNPINLNDPTGKIFCVPCVTGLIGGTGAALGSIAAGNDVFSWETAASFGAGALVGSGVGLFAPSVGALGTAVIGTSSAVSTDIVTQGILLRTGHQENFDFGRTSVAFAGSAASSILPSAVAGTTIARGGFSLVDALLFEANAIAIGAATNNVFDSVNNFYNPTSSFDFNFGNFDIPDFSNLGQPYHTGGLNLDLSFDPNFDFSTVGGYNFDGGFVLYPNKPNNNMMRRVYSK